MAEPILQVSGLTVKAATNEGTFTVIDHIDFSMQKGEILGIVGESGCGKSMTALSIAGLLPANVQVSEGKILFDGKDLKTLSPAQVRSVQGRELSVIFQEPMTSLNPLMKIGRQVGETLALHTDFSRQEIRERTRDILGHVGLPNPEELLDAYPHELSGGMRQRVMIAMAVICKPKLLIADEPTTALDVTIQAQILELLREINREVGCAILFISHDLGVISQLCSRTAVMYAGTIVEEGKTEDLFCHPAHAYTQGLLQAIPTRASRGKWLYNIPGSVPDLSSRDKGCPFASRCGCAGEACLSARPGRVDLPDGHRVYCVLAVERVRHYASI